MRKIGTITPKMQENWFKDYETDESIYTFAIEELLPLPHIIGSIAVYGFCDGMAEIGKIQIGDINASGKGYGMRAIAMAAAVAFKKLGTVKLRAEIHPNNIASLKGFTRAGYIKRDNFTNPETEEYEFFASENDVTKAVPFVKEIKISE